MTAARLKRIACLEARRQPDKPWVDPFPVAIALFEALQAIQAAERAGREFCRLPAPTLSADAQERVEWTLRESHRIAERLKAERGE